MNLKNRTKKTLLLIILISSITSLKAQVGINTEQPTSVLDINGDLRIREVEVSTTTDDIGLVVDKEGNVKKSITSQSYFKGYLARNFTSSTENNSISRITGFLVVDQASNEFNLNSSTFTPSLSGLYNINLTFTATPISNITTTNVVYGLVDSATNKWVMRFSVPTSYISSTGLNSVSGAVTSFSGAVMLTKGKSYHFGITQNITLLSNPSGNTGEGIGSYVAIELIKSY